MDLRIFAPPSAAVLITALLLATSPVGASSWSVALRPSSNGEARAQAAPSAPTGVSASCVSSGQKLVSVLWIAVSAASSYTIYKSATLAGSYTSTASGVTGTSWTSGTLTTGNVYFKVAAYLGTKWMSAQSADTSETTINSNGCIQP
jgi:hypothetical protein